MRDKFYELSICSVHFYDEILELLFSFGVICVEELGGAIIVRDEDDLSELSWGINEYVSRLSTMANKPNDLQINLEIKQNRDWINEYKKAVKPILIDRIYIHPSWEEPKSGVTNIIIDPALAFGSGHHESTNSCVSFLQKYAKDGARALDVGCGSGILSIVLAKLGCVVDACDTDEQAVDSSISNANLNNVKFNKIWTGSVTDMSEKYDIVVANIIADVIFMLSKELKSSLKDGAYLILSGILNIYKERIKQTFNELELVEMRQLNDWLSFVFKK
ncbi:50S ribosomal protein L11 methyltransferase [Campylobacter sp. faydin G-24]|uniref:Ribosomal protein L11 methyltransferase n=1 Tax=Campylobacter anatolicus TaxID=2829105 RepID=A0ABS5HGP5_9BACT|nr:50S ribosomal protein L11 methyltransferase [Campylobacter anatolicus]MBR8461716.1 50S ribosomal protein L11 methyltransferase [Campylobacter anatolicus]MBR8463451.1 50S ribosomal protein L11 methyltransferase [Campylobacter anatolicus]MBR8465197.1 50S ribosomal protein L11 methyltransferase [Campylobacter anatolicus]